jgi:hypothetical protein
VRLSEEQELARALLERLGDADDDCERGVGAASLDAAHVRRLDAEALRGILDGPPLDPPEGANFSAESDDLATKGRRFPMVTGPRRRRHDHDSGRESNDVNPTARS